MDWNEHLRQTAAWLVELADNPLTSGSKGYAAHRLAELTAAPMYADLPRLIREERARQSSSESEPAADRTTASTGPRSPGA